MGGTEKCITKKIEFRMQIGSSSFKVKGGILYILFLLLRLFPFVKQMSSCQLLIPWVV
jgi:hypothetical protein